MTNSVSLSFLLLTVFTVLGQVIGEERITFPLLMPDVSPNQKDTYFCTAFKVDRREHKYIIEFTPNATMNTAHHILLYGCQAPGYYERDTPRGIWDCGEMAKTVTEFPRASTCASGSQIVYAWAMDAPKLVLPEGVGFKIGGSTGINYLVLQVHYANVDKFLNGDTDNSGIILTMLRGDTEKVTKRAGVLLLGTGGALPPKRVTHMETTCMIEEPLELHPFAFRTHTHKLGTAVSGWRVDPEGRWTLVGRHNPQEPQMFYPVEDKSIIVKEGDVMAARCTMNNTLNHKVRIGSTGDDEMCNFYMMYYIEGDKTLKEKYCFSMGPPMYSWKYDRLLGGVPAKVDIEASRL
ncbi:Peptidylglycine alpha-hydroxylating monooxygenase [Halotydeus destructor]|nr:Peptidylglycine alpha-hydroxylating monooxygenase [Halotydeus destructor]